MTDVETRARQTEETLKAATIAPSITVNDLARSLSFYQDGLGFGVEEPFESEGVVRGYMLKAGNARLGISQDDFAKGRDRVKGVGMRLWISTEDDIAELADRARAAGIKLDEGPAALDWGGTAITLTDPDGFKLTFVNRS
jgi:uncharacterized glyoxalase superfamily protein PhnB